MFFVFILCVGGVGCIIRCVVFIMEVIKVRGKGWLIILSCELLLEIFYLILLVVDKCIFSGLELILVVSRFILIIFFGCLILNFLIFLILLIF